MYFVDTHCHIHEPDYKLDINEVEANSLGSGVGRIICVGTDVKTSQEALEFVQNRPQAWASVGLHPHDAKVGGGAIDELEELIVSDRQTSVARTHSRGTQRRKEQASATGGESKAIPVERYPEMSSSESGTNEHLSSNYDFKIIAIGECGLDYFYENSPKDQQIKILHEQIKLAQKYNLPLIFHVREAFDDFWPIFDAYKNLHGVLHSFTDNQINLNKAIERGLFIGVNGIVTFTKNDDQLQVYKNIPLAKMLLETDAPFLTPNPIRGTVNEPAKVKVVAEFLAKLRGESVQEIANVTTKNALSLFNLK